MKSFLKIKIPKISFGAWISFVYLITMPFAVVKFDGGSSYLRYISIMVIGCYFIEYLVHKGRYNFSRQKNKIYLAFICYFVYSLTTVLWSVMIDNSINLVFGMALVMVVFIMFTGRKYSEEEERLIKLSWILVALIMVYMTIFNGEESGYARITASFLGGTEDKNQLCGYYFYAVILLVYLIQRSKKYIILAIIISLLILYSVFLTGSRGGLLSIVACVFLYLMFYQENFTKKHKFTKKVIYIMLIVVFAIFALEYILPYIPEATLKRMSIEALREDKGSGRSVIWATLWQLIHNNPFRLIFGYGLVGTAKYIDVGYAHNQIFQVFFDGGLLGLILFTTFLIRVLNFGLKNNKVSYFAFIGMFILSLTITTYTVYRPYWNLLMMLLINRENSIGQSGSNQRTIHC